jgi:hypothetical protein
MTDLQTASNNLVTALFFVLMALMPIIVGAVVHIVRVRGAKALSEIESLAPASIRDMLNSSIKFAVDALNASDALDKVETALDQKLVVGLGLAENFLSLHGFSIDQSVLKPALLTAIHQSIQELRPATPAAPTTPTATS